MAITDWNVGYDGLKHGAGPSSWPPAAMNSDPSEKQSVYCYATHYYLVPVLWDRTPPKNDTRGGLNLTLGAKTISGPVSRVPPIFKSSSQSAGSLTLLGAE